MSIKRLFKSPIETRACHSVSHCTICLLSLQHFIAQCSRNRHNLERENEQVASTPILKKLMHQTCPGIGYISFTFYMAQRVGQKSPEATSRDSNPGIGYIYFLIYTETKSKIYLFRMKFWIFVSKYFFFIPPLWSLMNWQTAGSKPSISYVLLYFIPKIIPKYIFFKHQNQVSPEQFEPSGGSDILGLFIFQTRVLRK